MRYVVKKREIWVQDVLVDDADSPKEAIQMVISGDGEYLFERDCMATDGLKIGADGLRYVHDLPPGTWEVVEVKTNG